MSVRVPEPEMLFNKFQPAEESKVQSPLNVTLLAETVPETTLKVALSTVKGPVPTAPTLPADSVPSVIDVPPEYELDLDKVSVPLPFLVTLPAPAITLPTVRLSDELNRNSSLMVNVPAIPAIEPLVNSNDLNACDLSYQSMVPFTTLIDEPALIALLPSRDNFPVAALVPIMKSPVYLVAA